MVPLILGGTKRANTNCCACLMAFSAKAALWTKHRLRKRRYWHPSKPPWRNAGGYACPPEAICSQRDLLWHPLTQHTERFLFGDHIHRLAGLYRLQLGQSPDFMPYTDGISVNVILAQWDKRMFCECFCNATIGQAVCNRLWAASLLYVAEITSVNGFTRHLLWLFEPFFYLPVSTKHTRFASFLGV